MRMAGSAPGELGHVPAWRCLGCQCHRVVHSIWFLGPSTIHQQTIWKGKKPMNGACRGCDCADFYGRGF